MKKLHVALSTHDLAASVADYSERLGQRPTIVVEGQYALWRTASLNFTVRVDLGLSAGSLRHLGWEDTSAPAFTESTDVNGIVWEHFSPAQQDAEIAQLWPHTQST